MTLPTYSVPTIGQPNSTEDVDIATALTQIYNILNGGIDASNITGGSLASSDGFTTGDFKDSARSASHGQWLLCDTDRELTQAQVEAELSLSAGDANAFVALLGTGAASVYGAAASGKVKVPGFAGVFALNGDGSHPLTGSGSTGGAETHTLTSGESGLPAHTHSYTLSGVQFSLSGGPIAGATGVSGQVYEAPYGGTTGSASANAGSSHNNMPPYRVKGHAFIKV